MKGAELLNTTLLEDFCSETGYVPYEYINFYKAYFSESIKNTNKALLIIYDSLEEAEKDLTEAIADNWETEYNETLKPAGITKKEFCKTFDENKDLLLETQIEVLKNNKFNRKR